MTKTPSFKPVSSYSFVSSLLRKSCCRLAMAALVLGVITSHADELGPLWQLAPDARTYVTSANYTERGLAFNPATTNVLVVSRAGGLNVVVLDASTGAELRTLNVDGIAGGTFALSMIGVSDDGVVYGANQIGRAHV